MGAPAIGIGSPSGESQAATRRARLAELGGLVFEAIRERVLIRRYPGWSNSDFEAIDAKLLESLRLCGYYIDEIDTLPFDDVFAFKLRGIDRADYLIQMSLCGPGFSIHASRVNITHRSLVDVPPGEDPISSSTIDIRDDYSGRIKLGHASVDRAFLTGMSMVIDFMDLPAEAHARDEQWHNFVQFITPRTEEFDQIREHLSTSTVDLEDDEPDPLGG